MQQYGVRSNQVTQVRGYADQLPRVKDDPYDPSNRRISILVKNAANGVPPQIKDAKSVGPTGTSSPPSATRSEAGGSEKGGAAAQIKPATQTTAPQTALTPSPGQTASNRQPAESGFTSKLISMLPGKKK